MLATNVNLSHKVHVHAHATAHHHAHAHHHHHHHEPSAQEAPRDLPKYDLFKSTALFPNKQQQQQQQQQIDWSKTATHHTHYGSSNNNRDMSAASSHDLGVPASYSPQEDPALYNDNPSYSSDILMHQLKQATELIQHLRQRVGLLTDEVQQKQQTIQTLQQALTVKDIKLKEQTHRYLSLSQMIYCNGNNSAPALQDRASMMIDNTSDKAARPSYAQELDMIRGRYVNTPPPDSPAIVMDPATKWQPRLSIDEGDKKMDYKRLAMDKGFNVDWDVLVQRITKNADQQASLFMQQKLKACSPEQKQAIFLAVRKDAYALMTNRFGNFLVQRLFELGSPDQIQALANVMLGRVLTLTCEPFACHVVQKALDTVNEETRAAIVKELCHKIPETITHKYACHVWQRVFEIRWINYPVAVMQYVHQALKGKWTNVALDETGSLVIQNIFESMAETDKRLVLDEILRHITVVAKGQWGNWVIQHILEQAEQRKDREFAFDAVLNCGIELSMDQYASKVVEKALSIGGPCYMEKFIHHITTESRSHRPRIALIDIASDQYGNYVVQWIINNAPEEHKVNVCRLIKRHMVSLRSSKYGQRVAFLVDKTLKSQDAITTYPTSTG